MQVRIHEPVTCQFVEWMIGVGLVVAEWVFSLPCWLWDSPDFMPFGSYGPLS